MRRRTALIVVVVLVAVAAALTTGIAIAASGGDDAAQPITGSALARASAAALEHTGGGRVTETEVGDEEGFYEVEVTLDDGSQVDVHLDRSFHVLGGVADDGTDRDGSAPDDD
jgi:uncharacterized membrane protein YkoI